MEQNYCVYGIPGVTVTALVQALRKKLKELQPEAWCPPMEDVHTTIMYGPTLAPGIREITQLDEVATVLKDFVPKFQDEDTAFNTEKVGAFVCPTKTVVKLEFDSALVQKMHMYLRDNTPSCCGRMFKETGKESYAYPPVNWQHFTIGEIAPDIPVEPVLRELNRAMWDWACKVEKEDPVVGYGVCFYFLKEEDRLALTISEAFTRVELVTAETDKHIVLWGTRGD